MEQFTLLEKQLLNCIDQILPQAEENLFESVYLIYTDSEPRNISKAIGKLKRKTKVNFAELVWRFTSPCFWDFESLSSYSLNVTCCEISICKVKEIINKLKNNCQNDFINIDISGLVYGGNTFGFNSNMNEEIMNDWYETFKKEGGAENIPPESIEMCYSVEKFESFTKKGHRFRPDVLKEIDFEESLFA